MEQLLKSQKIKELCKNHNITFLGLFGSYARNQQTESSDIDLLVEFKQPVGYLNFIEIQNQFKQILNKDIDLVTTRSLSKYIKPYVIKDLQSIYDKR